MIKAVPISLKEAQNYVDELHRHHIHAVRDKFRVGAEVDGELVGVVQVGQPVSRMLNDGKTLEVVRCCTKFESGKNSKRTRIFQNYNLHIGHGIRDIITCEWLAL